VKLWNHRGSLLASFFGDRCIERTKWWYDGHERLKIWVRIMAAESRNLGDIKRRKREEREKKGDITNDLPHVLWALR
jgi:hypothetical protein